MMQGREGETLMEEDLGKDGMRGLVLNPQKKELGLDGIGGSMNSSLRTKKMKTYMGEKRRAEKYFEVVCIHSTASIFLVSRR